MAHVPWSHLIRFTATGSNDVQFGDAVVDSEEADIGLSAKESKLKAKLIKGDPLSPDCQVTDEVVEVGKLLGPLTPRMVPSVRCIGLNYLKHSRSFLSPRHEDVSSSGG